MFVPFCAWKELAFFFYFSKSFHFTGFKVATKKASKHSGDTSKNQHVSKQPQQVLSSNHLLPVKNAYCAPSQPDNISLHLPSCHPTCQSLRFSMIKKQFYHYARTECLVLGEINILCWTNPSCTSATVSDPIQHPR